MESPKRKVEYIGLQQKYILEWKKGQGTVGKTNPYVLIMQHTLFMLIRTNTSSSSIYSVLGSAYITNQHRARNGEKKPGKPERTREKERERERIRHREKKNEE